MREKIDQGNLLKKQISSRASLQHYSKFYYDCAWSSQEWKAEVTTHDRSGRLDNIFSQEVANSQNFFMGSDTTELEQSVESRSFVNRVNDQVRKRQKGISNVAGEGEEHSIIWGMFMAVSMESATFMGKEFQKQSEFHCKYCRSHTEANVRHIRKISGRTG